MRKPKLTLDQHTDLGQALYAIREELTHRYVQVANAYPLSGPESTPARHLNTALNALDEARSALDGAVFREHRDDASPAIYYPGATHVGSGPTG